MLTSTANTFKVWMLRKCEKTSPRGPCCLYMVDPWFPASRTFCILWARPLPLHFSQVCCTLAVERILGHGAYHCMSPVLQVCDWFKNCIWVIYNEYIVHVCSDFLSHPNPTGTRPVGPSGPCEGPWIWSLDSTRITRKAEMFEIDFDNGISIYADHLWKWMKTVRTCTCEDRHGKSWRSSAAWITTPLPSQASHLQLSPEGSMTSQCYGMTGSRIDKEPVFFHVLPLLHPQ